MRKQPLTTASHPPRLGIVEAAALGRRAMERTNAARTAQYKALHRRPTGENGQPPASKCEHWMRMKPARSTSGELVIVDVRYQAQVWPGIRGPSRKRLGQYMASTAVCSRGAASSEHRGGMAEWGIPTNPPASANHCPAWPALARPPPVSRPLRSFDPFVSLSTASTAPRLLLSFHCIGRQTSSSTFDTANQHSFLPLPACSYRSRSSAILILTPAHGVFPPLFLPLFYIHPFSLTTHHSPLANPNQPSSAAAPPLAHKARRLLQQSPCHPGLSLPLDIPFSAPPLVLRSAAANYHCVLNGPRSLAIRNTLAFLILPPRA
ncbi:hypothetical protein F5Y18DRAFT_444221 [Xylariaceae sp. FL1019]|nr:hypothetical protein F5Y18DRAFT_444221 [Xylariaceae sp. FL1019]